MYFGTSKVTFKTLVVLSDFIFTMTGGFDGKLNHCIGRVSGRGKSSPWTWILYQVAFAVQPEEEEFVVNGICAFVVGYEVFVQQ